MAFRSFEVSFCYYVIMIKVKICGIKRIEDALAAISYGADAIGLLVGQEHTSDDFIDDELAKSIVEALPPFCSSVMVTHLTDVPKIIELASKIGVTTIQLHGYSKPSDVNDIKIALPYIKIYKAIHITGEDSVDIGKDFLPFVDAVLLDTTNLSTGQVGGTGITHDWSISKKIVQEYNKPVILAGGLTPDNVADAIKYVMPFGVDVNSGIKGADGYKDKDKLNDFIGNAKLALGY